MSTFLVCLDFTGNLSILALCGGAARAHGKPVRVAAREIGIKFEKFGRNLWRFWQAFCYPRGGKIEAIFAKRVAVGRRRS
jgi:hypothetical protein